MIGVVIGCAECGVTTVDLPWFAERAGVDVAEAICCEIPAGCLS